MYVIARLIFSLQVLCIAMPVLEAQEPDLYPVAVNRFYGYIDATGKMVIRPQYSEAYAFQDSMALVGINGQFGYIDARGLLVIPPQYGSQSRSFREGLAPVFVQEGAFAFEGKYGYVNKQGEMVIKPAFEDALPFSEGQAAVKVDGKWGSIDRSGDWTIPARLEELGPFSEGRARFLREGRYGFFNPQGVVAIPAEYELAAEQFSEGKVAVLKGGKWGFIDSAGNWIRSPAYSNPPLSPPSFSEGLAAVVNPANGKWGFIDQKGTWVLPADYEWAYGFSNGLAAVYQEMGWGFINPSGKMVIPVMEMVDEVGSFKQALCPVSIEFSWNNYLDKKGDLIWRGK